MNSVISRIFIFFLLVTSFLSQNIDLRNPSDQYDYVIITKTDFVNSFDQFIEHKSNVKSLKCAVVTTEDIYNEFTDFDYPHQNIRGFISYAGKYWPEPQPKYFLIAGDIDSIPNYKIEGVRETDTVYTDYYYSVDIDSDDANNIDYYVGRVSARTNLELTDYLSKVISYESTPVADWNNDIMLVGVDDESSGEFYKKKLAEFSNSLFEYLRPTIFLSPSMYDENELRNNIINGINIEGNSAVFFWTTHNNNEVFGDPPILDLTNIDEINTDYYPFISFLGQQKFSTSKSAGLLDRLLFNKKGAIAGFNAIAPFYVNAMTLFYREFAKFLFSENANSIAGAAAKTLKVMEQEYQQYVRNDLFGIFGDPSIVIKYDVIASTGKNEIVKTFKLEQNYPNPFNPATQISFSIPQKEFVELKVYDMLGREVATLIESEINSGEHTVNFNASSFSSGVYLYQIKAGIFNQTRKMILIK